MVKSKTARMLKASCTNVQVELGLCFCICRKGPFSRSEHHHFNADNELTLRNNNAMWYMVSILVQDKVFFFVFFFSTTNENMFLFLHNNNNKKNNICCGYSLEAPP